MKQYLLSCAAACLTLLLPSMSPGQATVHDPFAGAPGPINGTGGGIGFSGNYSGAGNVVSPGLSYPGLASSGNAFSTAGSNNGAFRNLGGPISTDAGTIFVSFLTAATPGTAPDYAGMSFYSGGQSTEEIFLGKPFQQSSYGFDVTGVGMQVAPVAAPVSTTPSLLVYRISFTPNGETIDFFANPVPGQAQPPPTVTFAIPEGALADTLTSIRMQSGEGAGTANPFLFDELRGGGSFADVTPVPEPAGLALLGAGALLALRRRRF